MPVTGTVWIDPRDGSALKSHMQIEVDARVLSAPIVIADTAPAMRGLAAGQMTETQVHSSASVTVSYRSDAGLRLLVPSEMLETYEGPFANTLSSESGMTKIDCRAVYFDFKQFGATSKWGIAR